MRHAPIMPSATGSDICLCSSWQTETALTELDGKSIVWARIQPGGRVGAQAEDETGDDDKAGEQRLSMARSHFTGCVRGGVVLSPSTIESNPTRWFGQTWLGRSAAAVDNERGNIGQSKTNPAATDLFV